MVKKIFYFKLRNQELDLNLYELDQMVLWFDL